MMFRKDAGLFCNSWTISMDSCVEEYKMITFVYKKRNLKWFLKYASDIILLHVVSLRTIAKGFSSSKEIWLVEI